MASGRVEVSNGQRPPSRDISEYHHITLKDRMLVGLGHNSKEKELC